MRRRGFLPIQAIAAGLVALSAGCLLQASAQDDDRRANSDEGAVLVATGDFNRDGIADLVRVTDSDPSTLTILLGKTDGSLTAGKSENVPGAHPRALAVGDFNRDGNADVIVGTSGGALLEFLGDGQGGMKLEGNVATLGSVASLATGQFTRDGKPGLVVSDFASNTAAILLGAGDGTFRVVWSFALPRRGIEFHIATADFNKDGIADLVITSEDSDDYEVMLGNGNGTFTYAPQLSHLKDPNSYCPT